MSTQPRCEHWGYRLVNGSSIEGLSIREVVYDDDGAVVDWAPFPAIIEGASREELKSDLEEMLGVLKQPILDEAELEQSSPTCPHCGQDRVNHEELS